jgi:hypothetical protein
MNYLKSMEPLESTIELFVREGSQFNGTNLALGSADEMKFAHNYGGEKEPLTSLPVEEL